MGSKLIFTSIIASIFLVWIITNHNISHNNLLAIHFDPQVAIDIDYYSKAAYCEVSSIQNWNCGKSCSYHPGMSEVQAFKSTKKEGQGYCGYDQDNKKIIVAFRGSSNLQNWIDDFEFLPISYKFCEGCKVHGGFFDTLSAISSDINSCAKNLAYKYPEAQVIITGHSLGGALATLSALEISQFISPSRIIFMNFGSPRVGNQQFSDYFNSIIQGMRVVNYKDIVPHLPFKMMSFKHINNEVWLLKDGAINEFKICSQQEDPTCSNQEMILSVSHHTNYFGTGTGC